jgi:RNA polymerase sigma-70 factor, ECF subfamily
LKVLARLQIGHGLQSKLDASDLVQEVFLEAHRDFHQFHGLTEAELAGWLRRILASNLANVVRHYRGTKRRDVRLERQLIAEFEQTSRVLAPALAADQSSPSHREGLSFPEVAERLKETSVGVSTLLVWPRCNTGGDGGKPGDG